MRVKAKHPLSDRWPKIWKLGCSSIGKWLDSAIKDQKNQNCVKSWFLHETLIRIGITCKKNVICVTELASGILLKVIIYFEVMVKRVRNCRISIDLIKLAFMNRHIF